MADELRQVDHDEIERLLSEAERSIDPLDQSGRRTALEGGAIPVARPFDLVEFACDASNTEDAQAGLPRDTELEFALEFGRARIDLQDLLQLHQGSVVVLDKLAEEPVDIVVGGQLIGKGEVLVLNDHFCVRVAELAAGDSGL